MKAELGFILSVIVLAVFAFIMTANNRNEPFGMSPGVLDQLASTRV